MLIVFSILLGFLIMAILMVCLWFYAKNKQNHGYVDVAWSFGVGLCVLVFTIMQWIQGHQFKWERGLLVVLLIGIWSFRLTKHLFTRVHGSEEDGRYQNLRKKWGEQADRNFLVFYQMQAVWCVLFALPLYACVLRSGPLDWFDGVGVLIWLICIVGESIADRQLVQFKLNKQNSGKLCDVGLWRLCRHPNYFFEWLIWFAYVAIGVTGPWGPVTLLGPLLMLIFLFGLTGIPSTEYRSAMTRPVAYRRYQKTTSALVPWIPKHTQD